MTFGKSWNFKSPSSVAEFSSRKILRSCDPAADWEILPQKLNAHHSGIRLQPPIEYQQNENAQSTIEFTLSVT